MVPQAVIASVLVVVAWSVLVGVSAPRWPRRWLAADRGPLRLHPRESAKAYRATGIPGWADRLPDAGTWFGGATKRRLPGTSPAALIEFLVETRRAEWVHWLSNAGLVPVAVLISPWAVLAIGPFFIFGNGVFIVICRHNRLRLHSIVGRTSVRELVS